MSEYIVGQEEPRRGGTFGAATLGTLLIGVGLAALVIFHFRAPPPEVIEHPPEIRVVEQPAPPPKVVIREVPVPAPPVVPPRVAPAAPAPAASQLIEPVKAWEGVWRRKEYPLPMFRLMQAGTQVSGTCAPNWQAIVPVRDGSAMGDTLEFTVDDQVFRLHVRMTLVGDDQAKVEQWVTDEDWMASLQRAGKAARTPQQAILARAILEQNAGKFRKPVTVGIFTRQEGG